MKIFKLAVASLGLVAVFGLSVTANADASTIAGLWNTGVDNSGAVLADGALDSHYSFVSLTGTAQGNSAYAGVGTPMPIQVPFWLANTATSRWITPTVNAYDSYDPNQLGWYQFNLGFDLTGFDPATASFAARWAVDQGGSVLLNGLQLAEVGNDPFNLNDFTTFNTWHDFVANKGFLPGMNVITFSVGNPPQASGNPIGLRVEFLDSFASPVPLPAAVLLFIPAVGALGLMARPKAGERGFAVSGN